MYTEPQRKLSGGLEAAGLGLGEHLDGFQREGSVPGLGEGSACLPGPPAKGLVSSCNVAGGGAVRGPALTLDMQAPCLLGRCSKRSKCQKKGDLSSVGGRWGLQGS